jgi:hypothetical protein
LKIWKRDLQEKERQAVSWSCFPCGSSLTVAGGNAGDHNTPFWHKDYFELKECAIPQMQKEAFPKLPLSDKKQKILQNDKWHRSTLAVQICDHDKERKLTSKESCTQKSTN